ncbi:MAG: SDR family oxidoreductase [Anaerolineae bacterium]
MGQTAMIWGASGGIGRALAVRLMAEGWTVVGVSRHPHDLVGVVTYAIEGDAADPHAVQRAVMAAAMEVETVDLWVYAAGDIVSEPVEELGLDGWRRILDANLTGAYLAVHHSLPLLAEDAHIVFLGAVSERLRLPGLAAYAAAKAGLEAFADTLRKEQRRRRVTVVRPGAVFTPLWDKVPMTAPKDSMTPEAVAAKVLEAYHGGHKGILDLVH